MGKGGLLRASNILYGKRANSREACWGFQKLFQHGHQVKADECMPVCRSASLCDLQGVMLRFEPFVADQGCSQGWDRAVCTSQEAGSPRLLCLGHLPRRLMGLLQRQAPRKLSPSPFMSSTSLHGHQLGCTKLCSS